MKEILKCILTDLPVATVILWHYFIFALPTMTMILAFAVALFQAIYWYRKLRSQK